MDTLEIAPPAYACVFAADETGGIGRDNDLPWPPLPGDLAFFARITTATRDPAKHNAVIMGRRTWDSIPLKYRPLPRRRNIVVSRTADAHDGADAARSLDEAIELATEAGVESIYLAGGGQLFALAIEDPRCAVLYRTRIAGQFPHDTVFPAFDHRFVLDVEDPARTDVGVTYSIQRWRRRDRITG